MNNSSITENDICKNHSLVDKVLTPKKWVAAVAGISLPGTTYNNQIKFETSQLPVTIHCQDIVQFVYHPTGDAAKIAYCLANFSFLFGKRVC